MSLIDESGDVLVTQVAPMSMSDIENRAYGLLRDLAPEVLRGARLDVAELVDHRLQESGIHFSPVHDHLLPNMYAFAQHDGAPFEDIEVLVQSTEWQNLFGAGRRAHHSRGTFMHELGHAILHVNQIRRRAALGSGLARASAREIKPYENAEWQAWAFAGCVLAPRAAILAEGFRTPEALAMKFHTSVDLMKNHLRRLGLMDRAKRGC